MNANKKTYLIAGTIIGIAIISGIYLSNVVSSWYDKKPTREQCSAGSVDACKSYIQEQQSGYQSLEIKMLEHKANADKAREIIQSQLSGYFQ